MPRIRGNSPFPRIYDTDIASDSNSEEFLSGENVKQLMRRSPMLREYVLAEVKATGQPLDVIVTSSPVRNYIYRLGLV